MVNDITQQFDKINDSYINLINISQEKFNYLKKDDFHNLAMVHKQEKKMYLSLVNEQKKLKEIVENICKKKNIEEKKLKNLFPLLTTKDKEKVMASQKSAFAFEQKLEAVLMKSTRLAQAMSEVIQNEIDMAMYIANNENRGSNSYFINEEF